MSEPGAVSGQRSAVSAANLAAGKWFGLLSLAPGFSRVSGTRELENRFNGFPAPAKPLKRFRLHSPSDTRLKPGANERRSEGRRAFASGGKTP